MRRSESQAPAPPPGSLNSNPIPVVIPTLEADREKEIGSLYAHTVGLRDEQLSG